MQGIQFEFRGEYRRPVPDYILQKQKFQINGKEFFCQQSHFENQLINGVQIKLKELRGLAPNPNLIEYLRQTQQIIFCASCSMVAYNTHKKMYRHLLDVQGEVVLLRSRVDRTNNREYLMWVEESLEDKEFASGRGFRSRKCLKEGKLKKKTEFQMGDHRAMESTFNGRSEKKVWDQFMGECQTEGGFFPVSKSKKNVSFKPNSSYILRVYDFTKQEFIYESYLPIGLETVIDIFFFCAGIKTIGYILNNDETDRRTVNFKRLPKAKIKGVDEELQFQSLQTNNRLQKLTFNQEEMCYYCCDEGAIFKLAVFEGSEDKKMGKNGNVFVRELEVKISQVVTFTENVLSMAVSDQYLAILTEKEIHFFSAFDSKKLYLIHILQSQLPPPLGLQFNKSTLLLFSRGTPQLTTYNINHNSIKLTNSTTLLIQNCKQIIKIFPNSISSQIFPVVQMNQKENRIMTKRNLNKGLFKGVTNQPGSIDVGSCHLGSASRTETRMFKLGRQKFRKVHGCAWLSGYVVEAEEWVEFGRWRQVFEAKRCMSLHPTGIYAVVCFKQSFKLYYLTYQGMMNTYRGDSLNDIQCSAISLEGNHLAVATTNTIYLYDFYSCKRIKILNLPLGICIQTMEYRGGYLVCCLKSKKMYIYESGCGYKQIVVFNPRQHISQNNRDILEGNTTGFNAGGAEVGALFFDEELKIIIFSAQNMLYFHNVDISSNIFMINMEPVNCFHYCRNLKTLFMGTQKGQVINFFWPNKPEYILNYNQKSKVHKGGVASMWLSADMSNFVTISEDSTLSVCQVTYLKNMKKMQNLQLIQYLSGNVNINYDFLSRKGFFQYTHTEFNSKLDQLKDHEQQSINLNFIMPEQRMKQREQMLTHVNDQTFKLTEINSQEFQMYKDKTNSAKDEVVKVKEIFQQFVKVSSRERREVDEEMFGRYLEKYEVSQKSLGRLNELKAEMGAQKEGERVRMQYELQGEKERMERDYRRMVSDYESQKKLWCTEHPEQLVMIEQQKQEFISQNLDSLEDMIHSYNVTNSTLSCRNSNLQKEINMFRRKIDEHRIILDRLTTNTQNLMLEKIKYQQTRSGHERQFDSQDKSTLVKVEKEFVKQTKILIEKDKNVDVKIFTYNKERSMLVHLEKSVEDLEQSIQKLVDSLIGERRGCQEEKEKIQEGKGRVVQIGEVVGVRRKTCVASSTGLKNYIFQLNAAADHFVSDRRSKGLEILVEKGLIEPRDSVIEEQPKNNDDELEKWIQDKIVTLSSNTASFTGRGKKMGKTTQGFMMNRRVLKTEGNQRNSSASRNSYQKSRGGGHTFRLKVSPPHGGDTDNDRQGMLRKRREVIFKQNEQKRTYERVKTDQVVYENSYNKIKNQNQDLIQNYNCLAMQSKKIVDSLKRQKMVRSGAFRRDGGSRSGELNPTPFQTYLKNKGKKQKKLTITAQIFEFQ